MKRALITFCAIAVLVGLVQGGMQCKDEHGNDVDWWAILKYPKISGSSNTAQKEGYGYAYCDSNNGRMTDTGLGLNTNMGGALASTLYQIYDADKGSTGYLMYDDQWPDGSEHDSYGHTKGEVCFNGTSGFWLIHSVPRFPPKPPTNYSFPSNEATYGQSFLCMSYPTSTFNTIGENFLYNKPAVFASNLPSSLSKTVPNIQKVIDKDFITTTPGTNKPTLKTLAGHIFHSFAKNGKWNQSLYEDLVQPALHIDAAWETWQNGDNSNKMPSFCQPEYAWNSMNVTKVSLTSTLTWKETQDHSKWGVSTSGDKYVCIGDMNRQWSQNGRGGGTACIAQSTLWDSFNGLVAACDCCGKNQKQIQEEREERERREEEEEKKKNKRVLIEGGVAQERRAMLLQMITDPKN